MSRAGGGANGAAAADSPTSAVFASMVDKLGASSINGDRNGSRNSIEVEDEWQEVAIGKGLALYNSMEIDRLKGHKRFVLFTRIT